MYRKRRSFRRGSKLSKNAAPIRAAARAATSAYTNTPMCKDLGKLWPECMVLKLPFHATHQAVNINATATIAAAGAYHWSYQYYPITGNANNGLFGGTGCPGAPATFLDGSGSGFTVPTRGAQGVARLLSAAGGAGVYQNMCVLRAKGRATLCLQGATGANLAAVDQVGVAPGVHFMHHVNNTDAFYTVPTNAASADDFWNQPDVRRKYTTGDAGGANSTAPNLAGTTSWIPSKLQKVSWPIDVMPHKLLRMGFSEYVSDARSFGTSVARPTQFAATQFTGCSLPVIDSGLHPLGVVYNNAWVHTSMVFTVLLKDVVGTIS